MDSFVMLIIGLTLGGLIAGLGIIYSKFSDRISELEAKVRFYRYTPYYDRSYWRRDCQNHDEDDGIPVKDENASDKQGE